MYKIILLPEAQKFYKKLYYSDQSHFDRITQALHSLKTDPFQGKLLRHRLQDRYSLRVGIYRIIYRIEKQEVTVYILDIGHRRNIYQ